MRNRGHIPVPLIIVVAALTVCGLTLLFAWHLALFIIREADGWDLDSISHLLQTSLPADVSDVTYRGARRGQLVWLDLTFTAPSDSLNSFTRAVCNQALQPSFDPSNAVYLSTSYGYMDPIEVSIGDQQVYAYSPPNRSDLSGISCEIEGGYVRIRADGTGNPRLNLRFSSVCFYPCRINNVDYELITGAPLVFRGFVNEPSGQIRVVPPACVELHPRISHTHDISYINSELTITIDNTVATRATVSELFQLEPLTDSNRHVMRTTLFDVCFPHTWSAGEHRMEITIAKGNGDTEYFDINVMY